ncbi:MAG: TRAP transporter substrate-binding protein [Thermodesulfobacteriota bacterium]
MKKIGIWGAITALSALLLTGVSPVQGAPITLSLADQNSDLSWGPVHATQPWAKKVEEATKGQVKIQIYPSQTLAKGKESWNAVRDGIADMAWFAGGQHPGMMPYIDVITLPGLFKTAEKGSEILWKLYERFPSIKKELADNQVILLHTITPFHILTSRKQVKTLEDLKGLKIRTVAGQPTEQMKLLGGIPIVLPMPECYEALDKGTVEGMLAPMEPIPGFKLYEVTKYIAEVPYAANFMTVIMNKKKWSRLSKENQDAIMSVSGLEGSKWFGKNFADSATEGVPQIAKKAGRELTVYTLPEAERQRWIEVSGKPLWEAWVKGCESKGLTEARKILETALEFSK